jgi:hypothetical protein
MTLRELALQHLAHNGMSEPDARAILDSFARTSGTDLHWTLTEPFLAVAVARRIDTAAINWMMAHRLTGDPA